MDSSHRTFRLASTRRIVIAFAAFAILAASCGGTGTSGASPSGAAATTTAAATAKTAGTVALLLPEKQTARYEAADRPFFEAKFKAVCAGATLIYSNAAESAATQQQQAEAAITQGAKVLVLDPVDGAAAAVIVNSAKAKGIPVISYDRLIQGGSKPDYYISFDNESVGKLQATTQLAGLAAAGKTNPKLTIINGSPKDNNATLFNKGAKAAFTGKATIVKEDAMANWKPEEAQQLMEQFIASLGKTGFDGAYVANDGGAGGAIAAMKAAGVDPKTRFVTGQDAEVAAVQRILAGDQFMTVYKAIQPQAEAAATLACDLASGKTPAASTTNGKVVNNGTVDVPSILLVPLAVTIDGKVSGTKAIKDTIVADKFYGTDTVAKICTTEFKAACTAAGIQ
jgi:D-xylose transport system substrate-binding protein